jgi:hypothetical protein
MITMATSTFNAPLATPGNAAESKPGFFAGVLNHIVEVQSAKARVVIADYMTGISDEELMRYGWTQQDIKRLRGK